MEWTEEQRAALDSIEDWNPLAFDNEDGAFFSLTGAAGTGKSTLVQEIVARYPSAVLAAMTGKAAQRLSECAGQDASTLHKILYWPPKPGEAVRFTRLRESPSGFIVIDESSMMTPSVHADLRKWAGQGVRLLLVGDSFQLPPVITGEELKQHGEDYSVFSWVKGAELKTVMRSVGGVLRAATKVRETGRICDQSDEGYEFVREQSPIERAVGDYCDDRVDHLLITWKNATRMAANRMVRERLGFDGPVPDEGEPVLIRKNGQGLLNGEIVECGGFENGPPIGPLRTFWMSVGKKANTSGDGLGIDFRQRVLVSVDGGNPDKGGEFFDGQLPWIKDWRAYQIDLKQKCLPEPTPITFGYCLTAHSAQGSQANRTTVFLERGDDKGLARKMTTLPSGQKVSGLARWVYTSMTRSKTRTTMVVGR